MVMGAPARQQSFPPVNLVSESAHRWVLPRHGKMRVQGVVFASESLLPSALGDRSLSQVENVACLPGIVRASYAMPDVHWGYGFPVGGVAATDVEDGGVVSPGGVGFDVCCGVRLLRSDIALDEARPVLPRLLDELARRIPRGTGKAGLRSIDEKEMRTVLVEGVDALLARDVGWPSDADRCEDRGRLDDADPDAVSERALARGSSQLGSL